MEQFTDILIRDDPPTEKPTDHIWPTKRQKMLLKYLGHDVEKMNPLEIKLTLREVIKKFTAD